MSAVRLAALPPFGADGRCTGCGRRARGCRCVPLTRAQVLAAAIAELQTELDALSLGQGTLL